MLPKNRRSNASIAAAVDAARKASIGGALMEAHEYAIDYAQAMRSHARERDIVSMPDNGP